MNDATENSSTSLEIRQNVELAAYTTLGLGGSAKYFVVIYTRQQLEQALAWANQRSLRVLILGGGSNLVVSDAGFDGLVLYLQLMGLDIDGPRVRAAASENWDNLVDNVVRRQLGGVECLSGIPGTVGATPIQNVGAYGQEVSEVIESVDVWDRSQGCPTQLSAPECGFSYRHSRFKELPERYVVLSVTFVLEGGDVCVPRYRELARRLEGRVPSLLEARNAVLELRAGKSMVLRDGDPDARSVGSFFTNPIVSASKAQAVVQVALREGIVADENEVPRYPIEGEGEDMVKLAAGWLIERAGILRGQRHKHVGISSKHALALVHHGGGSTQELIELARVVRERVQATFGVDLVPEARLVGLSWGDYTNNT